MSYNDKLPSIKIILLGNSGVGKSSIIRRYFEDIFDENLSSTYSSNFLDKIITLRGKKVRIEVWDTAGQEEFRSITKIFVKNSKIIILVYSVTSKKDFEDLSYWYNFIQKEIGQDVVLGLAGNKTDLIFEEGFYEEVSQEEGKEYANKINAVFSLISAKESSKEIVSLFNQLIEKYLDSKNYFSETMEEFNENIRLSETLTNNPNKNECCIGKRSKNLKLRTVFLGCNGVGKTSIIKTLKGNEDIYNLEHTKKLYKEEIIYTKKGHKITVQLRDTNGDECHNDNFTKAIEKCNVFFLVFDLYNKSTLDKLEIWLEKINTKDKKIYLLGYNNDSIKYKNSELDCSKEVDKFIKKYNCEYESITLEDIYKIKAIIIDNITEYLKKFGY